MEESQGVEEKQSRMELERLSGVIQRLRSEDGCPWDKKQTPRSMTVYLVEEVYELVDAIYADNAGAVCEELGDVFFQLLFIAEVYREQGAFDMETAAAVSADKMIRRHPHVFGDKPVNSIGEVKERWHKIKQQEKADAAAGSLMDSVPRSLPALLRAYRISSRASRAGFDWGNKVDVMAKAAEELAELSAAVASGDDDNMAEELGDLLFTMVNVARFLRLHPETALALAVEKFETRFRYLEKRLAEQGRAMEEADAAFLDELWEEAKGALRP